MKKKGRKITKDPAVLGLMNSILNASDKTANLEEISDIEVFKPYTQAYELLTGLIATKTRIPCYYATILNAIFTQRTSSFMFSREKCKQLMAQEFNHQFKSISNGSYSKLLKHLIEDSGLFVVVEPYTKVHPGFYKLDETTIQYSIVRDMTGNDVLKEKYEQNYDVWKKYNKAKKKETMPDKVYVSHNNMRVNITTRRDEVSD